MQSIAIQSCANALTGATTRDIEFRPFVLLPIDAKREIRLIKSAWASSSITSFMAFTLHDSTLFRSLFSAGYRLPTAVAGTMTNERHWRAHCRVVCVRDNLSLFPDKRSFLSFPPFVTVKTANNDDDDDVINKLGECQ